MTTPRALALALSILAACGGETAGRLSVAIEALSFDGVGQARYRVTVVNANGAVIADEPVVTDSYDGTAHVTYTGPCDAGANPNTVTLTLEELRTTAGVIVEPGTYENPTPLVRQVRCLAGGEVTVAFRVQLEVSVNLEDVFCSAKLDCLTGSDGAQFDHTAPAGMSDTTMVLAFACTAGAGQQTMLHLNDMRITCDDGLTYPLDPTVGPGNAGDIPDFVFQHAVYRGDEALTQGGLSLDKCYWNMAIGISTPRAGHTNCRLHAEGTVSHGGLTLGVTPSGAVYPYILWDVPITGPDGALSCTQHPLDVPGSGVSTEYTDFAGKKFCYWLDCGSNGWKVGAACTRELSCPAAGGPGGPLSVMVDGDHFAISAGGKDRVYALPAAGLRIPDCCAESCCLPP